MGKPIEECICRTIGSLTGGATDGGQAAKHDEGLEGVIAGKLIKIARPDYLCRKDGIKIRHIAPCKEAAISNSRSMDDGRDRSHPVSDVVKGRAE